MIAARTYVSVGIVVAAFLWWQHQAVAFSVQLEHGTDHPQDTVSRSTTGSDLPTPQLVQLVLGGRKTKRSVPAVVPVPVTEPAANRHVFPAQQQTLHQQRMPQPAPARQLSGVEMYLLRHTRTVAGPQHGQSARD